MTLYRIAYAQHEDEVVVTQLMSDADTWRSVCEQALELVAEESGTDVNDLLAFSVHKVGA